MPIDQLKNGATKNVNPFAKGMPFQSDKGRRRERSTSEYGKSLREKQTLKTMYGLSEKQFKKYVKETLDKMQKFENVSDELIKKLEKRLDNVVFRLGFAKTRSQARQLVSHAYFTVNKKPLNIPSSQVSKGDIVAIKETKKKKSIFRDLAAELKKYNPPSWLAVDKDKLEGEITGEPTLTEVNPPVEISIIFEFYSR